MPRPPQGKYLYCIGAGEPPLLPPTLRGIDDLPLSFLRSRDLAALTSDVEAQGEIPLTRERSLAHMRVNETVMALTPVLPLAFGVVAPSAFAVERELLAANAEELRRIFERIGRCVEIDLVALWTDLPAVFATIARSPELARVAGGDGGGARAVTRPQAIAVGQWVKSRLEEVRAAEEAALLGSLAPHAAERLDLDRFGDAMVCRTAFLVPRENLPAFESEAERQGARGAPRLRLKLIGPTPPFHFVRFPISFATADVSP